MAGISADSKTWADATPLRSPATILRRYRDSPPANDEGLSAFVAANFAMDEAPRDDVSTAGLGPRAAIAALWPALTRATPAAAGHSSLLPLPHPYLAPGGRFTETYYWDAYFTLLGMGDPLAARQTADNFAHLIRTGGHVPNGNRSYYLSRSQPPVFFLVVGLTEPADPVAAYVRYLPDLIAEHRWWMRGAAAARLGAPAERVVRMADGALLNRYWDAKDSPRDESFREDALLARRSPQADRDLWRHLRAGAESGWDFSSRWLSDRRSLSLIRTGDIVPIDLNSMLFGLEGAIAEGLDRVGDLPGAARYRLKAERRRRAVVNHLWNAATGLFDDHDWTGEGLRGAISAAAVYPLFFRLADPAQAASTARVLERELLAPGGLMATNLVTGQQWDAPNGWAPLQWFAVQGFAAYGYEPLAREIASRWCRLVFDVYDQTLRFLEKYDVVSLTAGRGGEYPVQDGFGWTNGVTQRLATFAFGSAGPDVSDRPRRSRLG